MKGESTTGSQALGAQGEESFILPRKSCPFWQYRSLLLWQHLRVCWMAGVGASHLKPGQAFWLFLASAIVCAPVEEQMPGAFADESTGCTAGLQNCSLPKALCLQFAWLLYNFADPLGMVGRDTHTHTHRVFPPPTILCSVVFCGGPKLHLWETGRVSCSEVTKCCCIGLSQVPEC